MSLAGPYRAEFDRSISKQSDLGFAETVRNAVRRLCQAEALVFDIKRGTNVLSPSVDEDEAEHSDLTADLQEFLEQDSTGSSATTFAYRSDAGEVYKFARLPLIARGEVVGKLAMAILQDNWDDTVTPALCIDVSRLVSLLVKDYCSKIELEVDLVDLQRRIDRMTLKAETDPLTLVANRASFEKNAQSRLNAGTGALAMLVLDVDNFKTVNDIYGHQFGDNYLRSIAGALQTTMPSGTLIGRMGGDEFCALIDLPSAARHFLDSLVKQLRACLQRSAAVLGKPELGRVSVGIGIYPMQARDYDSLFSAADAALYASKRSGRNTTTVFNSTLENFRSHRDFAECFAHALNNEEIVAHFQPIVALETGACNRFEVLARWHDTHKGLITPQTFEPVFHDYRMAAALTSRIVGSALDQVPRLQRFMAQEQVELWFNVTTFDLLNPEFVFDMQSALVRNEVGWDQVVIEVTERVMLGDRSGQVYRTLDEVRRRGGRIAFDDFGTGHAGLLHIKDWPVDIIKIDRSFTGGVGSSERDQVVIEALLNMAQTMGQDVVAEGIETQSQLAALQKLGCRYGQGFLFSAALAPDELSRAPRSYESCHAIAGSSATPG